MNRRVHLDTDLGTNPDDAAALALLLARPEVELVGVTTVDDPTGDRAAAVREVLAAAKAEVPVGQGSGAGPLLRRSLRGGATLLAVGPLTNLAALERSEPGILRSARVVVMGGWVASTTVPPGHPRWGPERDTNVVADPDAATTVFTEADALTVVTLAETVRCGLRMADLPRLAAAGRLGALLADQVREFARQRDLPGLASAYPALPADLALLLHDPLAAAVAVGWPGAGLAQRRLRVQRRGATVLLEPDPRGRPVWCIDHLDAPAFVAWWLDSLLSRDREEDSSPPSP